MADEAREYRVERDSIGEKELPGDAYYGIHALRAVENFPITGRRIHPQLIRAIACIKLAAARVNAETGELDARHKDAIVAACAEILQGKWHGAFIVDPLQGGAGTSINMNANEVIANRAIELLGGRKGDYELLSPLDEVNCGQSTNDVIPTAGRMAALALLRGTGAQLERLQAAFSAKAEEFDDVVKMGRTQLQDAVPVRLGQEFAAFSAAASRCLARLETARESLFTVNLGGTAIGTGLNAGTGYSRAIVPAVAELWGEPLVQSRDLIDATQALDDFVLVSGAVKSCAVALSKICNDLRLLSSGPRCGLGEINLPPKQNGSSIMPGKVNPVIPEVMNQVAFNIVGNDVSITLAAEAGQLELNVFEPVIFYNLFESIETLTAAVKTLVDNCICGITANRGHCRQLAENSIGIITAINPSVGYEAAAGIAKEALVTGKNVRELVLKKGLMGREELDAVLDLRAMTEPGILGRERKNMPAPPRPAAAKNRGEGG